MIVGFSKEFIEKAFSNPKDRVNRAIPIEPEELLELPDEDIKLLDDGVFSFLPHSDYVRGEKENIRKRFSFTGDIPTVNGRSFPVFAKVNAWKWRKILGEKPTIRNIMALIDK